MTESEVIQALITANVSGGQIYPIEAPDGTSRPYTIYSVLRNSATQELSGDVGHRLRIMFTSWTDTYSDAVQLIADFRTEMTKYGFMAGESIIDKDPDTGTFRVINNDWYVMDI